MGIAQVRSRMVFSIGFFFSEPLHMSDHRTDGKLPVSLGNSIWTLAKSAAERKPPD